MLFDINEKAKIMTREEFLNEIQVNEEGEFIKFFNIESDDLEDFSSDEACPSSYNLKEYCPSNCKDCWTKATEPIKFKDEENK